MIVGKGDPIPTLHESVNALIDRIKGADVFTDAPEAQDAVKEIRDLVAEVETRIKNEGVLVALDHEDITMLASDERPILDWLIAFASNRLCPATMEGADR